MCQDKGTEQHQHTNTRLDNLPKVEPKDVEIVHLLPWCVFVAHIRHGRDVAPSAVAPECGRKHLRGHRACALHQDTVINHLEKVNRVAVVGQRVIKGIGRIKFPPLDGVDQCFVRSLKLLEARLDGLAISVVLGIVGAFVGVQLQCESTVRCVLKGDDNSSKSHAHTVFDVGVGCEVAFVLQAKQRVEVDAAVVGLLFLLFALALPLHPVTAVMGYILVRAHIPWRWLIVCEGGQRGRGVLAGERHAVVAAVRGVGSQDCGRRVTCMRRCVRGGSQGQSARTAWRHACRTIQSRLLERQLVESMPCWVLGIALCQRSDRCGKQDAAFWH